jgi:hypothetical protein
LHQTLRMELEGLLHSKSAYRACAARSAPRGLTENQGFCNLIQAGFVCIAAVSLRQAAAIQPPGARYEITYFFAIPNKGTVAHNCRSMCELSSQKARSQWRLGNNSPRLSRLSKLNKLITVQPFSVHHPYLKGAALPCPYTHTCDALE